MQTYFNYDCTPRHVHLCAFNASRFTGKERDSESNLDNFGARYYGSSMGRFSSPDEPFIDQDEGTPQSWNLYSYVRNNPLNATDPTGHHPGAYRNDSGNGIESTDSHSSAQECQDTGGQEAVADQQVTVTASDPDALPAGAVTIFADINRRNVMNNTLKMFGAGAAIGLTGGTACYYLCPAATATTLGVAGTAGAAAAPVLLKTGDVIDEVVQTPQGPVRIVADVVVEGTNVIIKDVQVYAAETGDRLNVGVGNMLKAIKPLMENLKDAGYTTLRILGDRSSAAGSANPGRPVDIFRTLR